jgi:hypothetical protein
MRRIWQFCYGKLLLAVFVRRILCERNNLRSPRAQIDQPYNRRDRRYQWTKDKLRGCVPGSVQHVMNAPEEV